MAILTDADFSIPVLRAAYAGGAKVADAAERLISRLDLAKDTAIFISRVSDAALRTRARGLDELAAADPAAAARMPLFGMFFAIKDNIDLEGLPTTAACPAFAYAPNASATAVARLVAAGAIAVGKTNLDQFATGLVGVRSPYGVPQNVFDARYVPGGSSSGSAVAVASGLVSFALGTDTAGSGRVPAAFNGIVGLKPTRGLVSTSGVVPACRSLDCVSVFARSVAEAEEVFAAMQAFDPADGFARTDRNQLVPLAKSFRFAVPRAEDLLTFGDPYTAGMFSDAAQKLEALGGQRIEISLVPFFEAAALLYDGPWLAERLVAVGDFAKAHPDAMHEVTRQVIGGGAKFSAADYFRAEATLKTCRRYADEIFAKVDVIAMPTAPTIYRLDELAAEPLVLNARLGTYTNFVNLLDMSALAVPAGLRPDGLPFGLTLIGPALADKRLAGLGRLFEGDAPEPAVAASVTMPDGAIALIVLGAHLTGMALNGELLALGGMLLGAAKTAPLYRLYLIEGAVLRPGMVRVTDGEGSSIEGEIWSLPAAGFGNFVQGIAPPLGIGTVELADGRRVKGFLCESYATAGARDITGFGGWRAFMKARG